ncbi:MAG: hypothetical protein KDN22_03600 [Verrucomicrobiae bacterium]|nr:hypothetical protein [Verrucomicrobiae bacterium]
MKASMSRTLAITIVFVLGVAAGRMLSSNAPGTAESPLRIDRSEAKAGNSLPLIGHRQLKPKHDSFRAALSEPNTYEKVLSLSAMLSEVEVSRFSKWWPLVQSDKLARRLLLDAWMRRDLSGLSTWLRKQPRPRILEVLGLIKSSSPNGFPASIVSAMSLLSLDILRENDQNAFLGKLLQIDPALAKAAAEHASPRSVRYTEDVIANNVMEKRIASDPRGVLDDHSSELSLDQRKRAIAQLGSQDLAEAFKLAESAPTGVERSTLQAAVVAVWAQSKPGDAIAWALGNLQGSFKNDALFEAIECLADHDGEQVELLQFANEMPNRDLRQILIGKVFDGWAGWLFRAGEKSPSEVAGFVDAIRAVPLEDLPLNERDIGSMWPNIDLVSSAAAVVEAPPELDIDHFTYYVAQRFNYKEYGPNPVAGIEWAAKLTPSRARVAMETIVREGQKEIALIADAVAKLPDGKIRSIAIPTTAEHWAERDREAAAAWLRELGDEAMAREILESKDPFAD